MEVLFLNHKVKQCGVYQYGLRLSQIFQKSEDLKYHYHEIADINEYNELLLRYDKLIAILYNYHFITMPWLNKTTIQKSLKNIGISHESPNDIFDVNYKVENVPRPLFEDLDLEEYIPSSRSIENFINHRKENVLIFGSFGFGFKNKNFHQIVSLINQNYDEAIIKLVIPVAEYDSNKDNTNALAVKLCREANHKPNIELMITHEFFDNKDILKFLSSNSLNIFLYEKMPERSISSVIDYALSVKTPFAISDSHMFRHIYSDEICLYKKSISYCIANSVAYCDRFREIYSNRNLLAFFRNII